MQESHGTYVINGEGRQRKVVAYVKKLSRFAGSAKETRADLANWQRRIWQLPTNPASKVMISSMCIRHFRETYPILSLKQVFPLFPLHGNRPLD
jgi:hypothetical protein